MLQQIERMMKSFSFVSGLKLALIDTRGRGLLVSGYEAGEYCGLLHRNRECLATCLQSNAETFAYVRQTKDVYVYQCPFGLTEIIAPIIEGDRVCGFFIAGPIIKDGAVGQQLLEVQAKQHDISDERELASAIERIRFYTEEEIRAFCDWLLLLASYIAQAGVLHSENKTVGKMVKDYVKRNLSEKITLEDLSLHIHCSTVTVTEHFRREYGMTVMQYVMKKRMELAKKLLLESRATIGDIALRCGFCDAEYFSRRFKGMYGVCPLEYRKTQQK
ncbi:MAG: PocR ligand-binding domain-containing protein [Clostridia bacterium]|nr:PocR ligand-binding domain-containing protein [Clostridia bacterium]